MTKQILFKNNLAVIFCNMCDMVSLKECVMKTPCCVLSGEKVGLILERDFERDEPLNAIKSGLH